MRYIAYLLVIFVCLLPSNTDAQAPAQTPPSAPTAPGAVTDPAATSTPLTPVDYNWPHPGKILAVSFSSDQKMAVSVNSEGLIKMWNTENGRMLRSIDRNIKVVAAAFFENKKVALARSWDGENRIHILDMVINKEIEGLTAHTNGVTSLVFSPDGELVLSGGGDHHVIFWGALYGELIHLFKGHKEAVIAAVTSSDQEHIVSIGEDQKVKVWNIRDSKVLREFEPHKKGVSTIAFSPDGQLILSGGLDKVKPASIYSLKLWDISKKKWWQFSKKPVATLVEHDVSITKAIFSPNGKRVLFADSKGGLKILDVETKKEVHTLPGGPEGIETAMFSSDGAFLLTGASGKLSLWKIPKETEGAEENPFKPPAGK
jgi:WD40 repeat protein